MSHFYVISDIHAHPYASGVIRGSNGAINFRLQNCLDCLEAACKASIADDVPLLIGGDLVEAKDDTSQIVTDLLFDLFSKYPSKKIIAIPGNHDFITKDGKRTVLGVLRDKITVITDPQRIMLQDQRVILAAVPFIRDIDELRTTVSQLVTPVTPGFTRVLLAHAYTQELMQKHEGIATNDLSAEFFAANFDLVLLGHHHTPDLLEYQRPDGRRSKVVSIGSPLQLTFSDRGQEKGFLKVLPDNLTVERIPLDMPKFIEVDDLSKIDSAALKGAFVRVKVSSGADMKALQKKLEKSDVLKISFVHEPAKKQERISGLRASMADDEILKKYIEGNAPPAGVEPQKLINLAKKYTAAV